MHGSLNYVYISAEFVEYYEVFIVMLRYFIYFVPCIMMYM